MLRLNVHLLFLDGRSVRRSAGVIPSPGTVFLLLAVWCAVCSQPAASDIMQCYLCGLENKEVGGIDVSKVLGVLPCPDPFNGTDVRRTQCKGACRKYTPLYKGEPLREKIMRTCTPVCTDHNKILQEEHYEARVECCHSDRCNAAPGNTRPLDAQLALAAATVAACLAGLHRM